MFPGRLAVFALLTLTSLGGETWAQVQVGFGKPAAVDEAAVPLKAQFVPLQAPNETAGDESGRTPPIHDPFFRSQSAQSPQERLRQASFERPGGADKVLVPQNAQAPRSQAPKETTPDEFGLTPPTRDQLFRVQSEQTLRERLRQGMPKVKKVEFPQEASPLPVVPNADLPPFPGQMIAPIASQVCYRPLYFEDKRTERFGQYVPCVQPLVSAGRFYVDVLILPCRLLLTPPWTFECDTR
jgi:hypothetical protein